MASVREVLRDAGIGIGDTDAPPALRAECARLASLTRARGARTLGLLPAADDVAVPPPALALGRALAEASSRPVGVVDAQGAWPCANVLTGSDADDRSPVATSWVHDGLAVLTPRSADPSGGLTLTGPAIDGRLSIFDRLVFDLTGLDHVGEHLRAFDLLDAVVVVARSGRTTTRQAMRRLREIPGRGMLGVLLTGL